MIRYDEEQIFEALLGLISVGNSESRPTKQDIAESDQFSALPDESVHLFQPKNESKKLLVFDSEQRAQLNRAWFYNSQLCWILPCPERALLGGRKVRVVVVYSERAQRLQKDKQERKSSQTPANLGKVVLSNEFLGVRRLYPHSRKI